MTLQEAIKKSIQQYYELGDEDLEIGKFEKDRMYTKKYFDDFEDEIMETKNRSEAGKNKKPVKKGVSDI